jgi:hypothetical protein
MQPPGDSDALRRYPLYSTPYLRRSSTPFNPSQSPFQSNILQLNTPSRPNCNCSCHHRDTSQLSTPPALINPNKSSTPTLASRKRTHDVDSEKENDSPVSEVSSPPKKKPRKYSKRRNANERLQDILEIIDYIRKLWSPIGRYGVV